MTTLQITRPQKTLTHPLDWFFDNRLTPFSFFDTPAPFDSDRMFSLGVNIKESGDKYVMECAAPGLVKDDIHLDIDNNVITISGSYQKEDKKEEENYLRREFMYGEFKRSFTFDDVDTDKIKASLENGVLKVTLPKKEMKKKKSVSIDVR